MSGKPTVSAFIVLLRPRRKPSPQHICAFAAQQSCASNPRPFSTSKRKEYDHDTYTGQPPRWQQTPVGMIAPVRLRPIRIFTVNKDPARLDAVCVKVLGPGGDKMLSEDVKWLVVTHKSFDHGRRGYNDRLAFFGKRIVELQASFALLSSPVSGAPIGEEDFYGRRLFRHPALQNLPQLTSDAKTRMLDVKKLGEVGANCGILGVLRWKPRKFDNLNSSGAPMALAQALYAFIGAVSLENGGEVANRIVRERILPQLLVLQDSPVSS